MKNFKIFFFFKFIFFLFMWNSKRRIFKSKKNNSDEFLVEKKSPLSNATRL